MLNTKKNINELDKTLKTKSPVSFIKLLKENPELIQLLNTFSSTMNEEKIKTINYVTNTFNEDDLEALRKAAEGFNEMFNNSSTSI